MQNVDLLNEEYDFVIIGSGFGGSVSALRLSEKGYKVLVVEKGQWFRPEDFPKTNWQMKRWLWLPVLKWTGIMRLSFFRHLSILSGSGVGGGSLVYACTLPIPKPTFFQTGSWASLNDWQNVLPPYYELAYRMLGAEVNPKLYAGDHVLQQVAKELHREDDFHATKVAIFFARDGQIPGKTVADPYFEGEGPERAPCLHCGACMTGCRHNAKNSLDKNYLYLAQKRGAKILAETLVHDIKPLGAQGEQGYEIHVRRSTDWSMPKFLFQPKTQVIKTRGVVFSAGALGTSKLLLSLKHKNSMPNLSERVGKDIRSNNECLITIATDKTDVDYSKGIAIGSVLHTDAHSHLEPVRYGAGSGAWRLAVAPMAYGANVWVRLGKMLGQWFKHPKKYLKIVFAKDWAKQSQVMLFMQHLDSTLQFKLNRFGFLKTELDVGQKPQAYIPRAEELAELYAKQMDGKAFTLFTEQLLDTASTAHVLGGAVMGADATQGVIDGHGRLFGYQNAYVCDGSMISANPGVNPSLSITAISEYVMAQIAQKGK